MFVPSNNTCFWHNAYLIDGLLFRFYLYEGCLLLGRGETGNGGLFEQMDSGVYWLVNVEAIRPHTRRLVLPGLYRLWFAAGVR